MSATDGLGRLVTVFGGSGFIGRNVVRALARRRWRIRVAVRRPDLAIHLQPIGTVGQIHAIQANIRVPWSIERALEGADAAVNLVGTFKNSGAQNFASIAAGAGVVAEAARAGGLAALVQMSAIGADPASPSAFARAKAAGEANARESFPGAVVMRPSVVFGPEDDFFNKFAGLGRLVPLMPLVHGGRTRFQPVYVGDVAEAIARAVDGEAGTGTTYELGGPEILTLRECLDLVMRETGRQRPYLPVPAALARIPAWFFEFLPRSLLTRDQLKLLAIDNLVSDAAIRDGRTLDGLGIDPVPLAAVLPSYLYRYRRRGQYDRQKTA